MASRISTTDTATARAPRAPAPPPARALGPDELRRYNRHIILPEIGLAGQERLARARVLVVGAGGLGSPVALYLAAAGVGRLGLVDFDVVDVSNLQRQLLHGTSDVGRRKTDSARDRLRDVNPHVVVDTHDTMLSSADALDIIREYDVVVDGTDNFQTRYLVNDACVLLNKPNVYGSVFRFEGQASVFGVDGGPCYRCLFREPPPPGVVPSCAEGGVFGVLPGLIGVIQATETIKLITGAGETLAGSLLLVDALRMRFRTITLRRDPECPMCGTREITGLIDYDAFCGVKRPGDDEIASQGTREIEPRELAARMARGEPLDLIDVRQPYEHAIASIAGAHLMPLPELSGAASTLPRDRDLVIHCHHGSRSAAAAEYLRSLGFTRVWNLAGGIDRWSEDVDPSIPRY
jgi:molybdopterin/thiamine biosynthesis adenylyltransferase/rhodanese-related sulfurtransferase